MNFEIPTNKLNSIMKNSILIYMFIKYYNISFQGEIIDINLAIKCFEKKNRNKSILE